MYNVRTIFNSPRVYVLFVIRVHRGVEGKGRFLDNAIIRSP